MCVIIWGRRVLGGLCESSTAPPIVGYGGGWASTDCTADVVRFSKYQADKFRDGSIVLSGLAVHEWGHVWGLGHAGRHFSGSGQNWNECQLLPTNLNGSQSTGSYEFQRTRYCYPGSGWGYCTTLYGTVASSDSGGRKPEALQMRIVVYNRMTIGGDPVKVDVDRTRILVIPS